MKDKLVSALLRIYPASWRKEYGLEFRHLLEKLDPRIVTVLDVVWNGALQRLRATEPWVLIGLPFAVFATLYYLRLIVVPPPYDPANDLANLTGTKILLVMLTNLSLTIGCGLWTVVRNGGTLPHAGLQTVKMALLIDVPHFIVYALILTGALGIVTIVPGQTPTTIAEHGFAIAHYSMDGSPPYTALMLLDRVISTLLCFVFGVIGGSFGRSIRARAQPSE